MRPAIQLYSLRELDEPLPTVLERVAEAGYEGVEFANRVREADLAAVEAALDRTGLVPVGAHVDLRALEGAFEEAIAPCAELGCPDVVVPHLSAAQFRTPARVDAIAARLRAIDDELADRDVRLHYHTQSYEFRPLSNPGVLGRLCTAINPDPGPDHGRSLSQRTKRTGGLLGDALYERLSGRQQREYSTVDETAFARLIDGLPQTVGVQIDTGAVAAAGFDPVTILERVGARPLSLHLADVVVEERGPTATPRSVEAGEGVLDIDAILAAAHRSDVDWVIYEHDDPPDPETTLARGIDVLDGNRRERRSSYR